MKPHELDQLRREVGALSVTDQLKLDQPWALTVLAAVEAGVVAQQAASREEDVLEVEVPSTETTMLRPRKTRNDRRPGSRTAESGD